MNGESRIVAVGGEGTFIVARYTASGTLDTSFGDNGTLNKLFTSVIGAARSVLVAPDNKVLIAGHIGHDFALVRLGDSGLLDETFGFGGKVLTPVAANNWDEAT